MNYKIFFLAPLLLLTGCIERQPIKSSIHNNSSPSQSNHEITPMSGPEAKDKSIFQEKYILSEEDVDEFVQYWRYDFDWYDFAINSQKIPENNLDKYEKKSWSILSTTIDLAVKIEGHESERTQINAYNQKPISSTLGDMCSIAAHYEVEFEDIGKRLTELKNTYPNSGKVLDKLIVISATFSKYCEEEIRLATSGEPSIAAPFYKARASATKELSRFFEIIHEIFNESWFYLSLNSRITLSQYIFKQASESITWFFNQFADEISPENRRCTKWSLIYLYLYINDFHYLLNNPTTVHEIIRKRIKFTRARLNEYIIRKSGSTRT